jgi:hypothetical protein
MGMCTALHDWIWQEDASGYEFAECAQCGAITGDFDEPDSDPDWGIED